MEKILSLEDLENSENKTLYFTFDEKIEGIDCVTPIHAEMCAKSLGDFVQITGHVTGVVNLECDLCLEKFEHNLDFDIEELYSKHSLIGEYEEILTIFGKKCIKEKFVVWGLFFWGVYIRIIFIFSF